jgi:Omp85 superfamily domain
VGRDACPPQHRRDDGHHVTGGAGLAVAARPPHRGALRGRRLVGLAVWTAAALAPAELRAAGDAVPCRREFGIVPFLGGDTDVGIGVGQLSCLACVAPGVAPFVWRVESAAFVSFKVRKEENGNTLVSPYQDAYVLVTLPRFLDERLRLDVRPSFTRETTQRYYGLGNASVAPAGDVPGRDTYVRGHPTLSVRLRGRVVDRFFWELGTSYTENWFDIHPESRLAADMTGGTPLVRSLLGTAGRHGVLIVENSLVYDNRDNEISTHRGLFLQLKLRYSPRLGDHLPYRYGQIDLTNRYYLALVPERLHLAVRTVIDLQLGDVPFYELARFEDTFALGGGNGVRGVPGQRYYGRAKVLANIELRSDLVRFVVRRQRLLLGSALFGDFGRLWATFARHPELDGRGLGLKYGLGGGLRLQQGETFVVRLDVAWSPDARPLGVYLTAGQLF